MSDIQREDSFRTTLKNQKRRLSATKAPTKGLLLDQEPPSPPSAQLKNVKISGLKPHRKSSIKEESVFALSLDESDSRTPGPRDSSPEEFNTPPESPRTVSPPVKVPMTAPTMLQAPNSPYAPRTPSPLVKSVTESCLVSNKPATMPRRGRSPNLKLSCSPAKRDGSKGRSSPVPPDSPLLCRTPTSPIVLKAREFNRELRRARSFHRSLERSRDHSRTRDMSYDSEDEGSDTSQPPAMKVKQEEICFSIKKHVGGRQGWKIMPDIGCSLRPEALKKVVGMIKEMELKGHTIPERISINM